MPPPADPSGLPRAELEALMVELLAEVAPLYAREDIIGYRTAGQRKLGQIATEPRAHLELRKDGAPLDL
jgi:hypothetical protein